MTTSTVCGCSTKRSGIFSKPEADVLEADLLRHREHGHGREAVVHRAEHAREDGPVAHACVEEAKRGRRRPQPRQLVGAAGAITAFSLQVLTKARYFWRLS